MFRKFNEKNGPKFALNSIENQLFGLKKSKKRSRGVEGL